MIDRSTGSDPNGTERPRGGRGDGPDEAALSHRLERLGASLEAHRSAEEVANSRTRSSGFAQATKIASEFVAGVIVGGGLGWGIDKALGTTPWGLILFVLLGFAAGVLNVLRAEGVVADAGARLRAAAEDPGSSRPRSPDDPGPIA